MQPTESTALFQHLTSLTEGFSQLSTRLAQVAQALQDPGKPPAESLVAALVASRRDFADLCARGLALAASLAVSPLPTREALASLSDLKSLLQTAAQAEEKKAAIEDLRQRALAALDRVLSMSHRDHIAFAPLLECQAKAGALRLAVAEALWSELHPATEALAKGEDPFSDLLTFVDRQGELDDDHWALLQNSVERSFSKPLAIAASRGKHGKKTSSRRHQLHHFPKKLPLLIAPRTSGPSSRACSSASAPRSAKKKKRRRRRYSFRSTSSGWTIQHKRLPPPS